MRSLSFVLGAAVLFGMWLGPLPALAAQSFAAHMTLHMGLVAVAAPLLALAAAGTGADPVARAPRLFAPLPASVLELIVVWAWHAPALHHLARHDTAGFVAEQGSFLLVGAYLWLSAFGGDAADRERSASGVIGLLLTAMHMTLLGALLALAPRPLYAHPSPRSWLSPLEDQHLGGAIMLLVGAVSYLAGGLWLSARLFSERAAAAEAAG